jgi:hypothetical protein
MAFAGSPRICVIKNTSTDTIKSVAMPNRTRRRMYLVIPTSED